MAARSIAAHSCRKYAATSPDCAASRGEPQQADRCKTAATMREMMEDVVLEGTGKQAQLDGYTAGGKSGTAQKIDPATGRYSPTPVQCLVCGLAPVNESGGHDPGRASIRRSASTWRRSRRPGVQAHRRTSARLPGSAARRAVAFRHGDGKKFRQPDKSRRAHPAEDAPAEQAKARFRGCGRATENLTRSRAYGGFWRRAMRCRAQISRGKRCGRYARRARASACPVADWRRCCCGTVSRGRHGGFARQPGNRAVRHAAGEFVSTRRRRERSTELRSVVEARRRLAPARQREQS